MQDRTGKDERGAVVARNLPRGTPSDPIVSNRDTLGTRLKRRLGRLDPSLADCGPTLVRPELVSSAHELRQRLPWWNALLAASKQANPALRLDWVLDDLTQGDRENAPSFLLLWRNAGAQTGLRARELIGFVPFIGARIATCRAPWSHGWSASRWPALTPLIHRRYQAAAARALANWMSSVVAPSGALILRDLAEEDTFANTLLSLPGTIPGTGARQQHLLTCRPQPELKSRTCPTGAGLEIKAGDRLTIGDLDKALSLAAMWQGGIAPNGIISPSALDTSYYSRLTSAAQKGQLTLTEALGRQGKVTALTLALTTSDTASILEYAAEPRLDRQRRESELDRALQGLVAELYTSPSISTIEAAPGFHEPLARHLTESRRLVDVTIAGKGLTGVLAKTFTGFLKPSPVPKGRARPGEPAPSQPRRHES